jgi:hypothetical protein
LLKIIKNIATELRQVEGSLTNSGAKKIIKEQIAMGIKSTSRGEFGKIEVTGKIEVLMTAIERLSWSHDQAVI